MSRPKEYYYYDVKKWIKMKDKLPDSRLQVALFKQAYKDAIEETEEMSNGALRIKAINEILIKKTRTYEGVAQEIHYDWRTVQNWVTAFVNLVGKKAGF